jgi:hypothetical protein
MGDWMVKGDHMRISLEIEARSTPDGPEMEVTRAWMGGEECVIGETEIELLDQFGGLQRLFVMADLAVKP